MGQVISLATRCLGDEKEQHVQQQHVQQQQQHQAYAATGGTGQVLFFPDGELPCRNMLNDGVRMPVRGRFCPTSSHEYVTVIL